jgi:hypothetical protein
MRFLYGDSAPFPLPYDFLATLEAFMAAATRIVQLEGDVRELARHTDEAGQARVKGLEALDQFHTVVMRAVQDTAQKVKHAHALDYAQRVAEFASRYVDEHRRTTLIANEREATQCKTENERRSVEQRQQLEGFLKVAKLPVTSSKVSMLLAPEGKEARPQMSAVFECADGIQTSFTLGLPQGSAWASPRKVADVSPGVELMVGVDKSWLRGTVTPKQLSVDDWLFTAFDVDDEAFALTLRRRLAERESLHFELRRSEGKLAGTVETPEKDASGPRPLDAADLPTLERVWQALRLACRDVVEHKEQLVSVRLDGKPVFEADLVIPFVVRLVTLFAPTVREIAKRSPNEHELSLKQESDAGRREEIYLRKDQLVSKLQPLPAAGRQVFAPLGLDTWVPGLTGAPPPAAPVAAAAVPGGAPPGRPQAPGSNRTLPES